MTNAEAAAIIEQLRTLLAVDDDGPEGSRGPRWIVGQVREMVGGPQIGRWGKHTPTDDPHLIWSKKWTCGAYLTWWCADSQGYTTNLAHAGLYSRKAAESVERSCSGDDFAIPLAMVGELRARTVASDHGISDLVRRISEARKAGG